MSSFGKRLKEWRKTLRLTQFEFAKLTGVHEAQIKKYETDTSTPSMEVMSRFALAGANLNWLLTGEQNTYQQPQQEENRGIELPKELLEHQEQIIQLNKVLAMMGDEKRASTLTEIFTRAQEAQQLEEMKSIIEQLRKSG